MRPYRNRTYTTPNWPDLLAVRLQAAGIRTGTLAVDGPATSLAGLSRQLPGLAFTNVTPFMISLREVKHPEELAVMRLCASLTDWAQDRYLEVAAPGKLCTAVDAEVSRLIYEEAGRRFPDHQIEVFMLALSGPASASPHGNGANAGLRCEKGHGAVNIVVIRLDGLVVENDAAAQAVIEAAGFGENILHRTGHGMGIAGHEFPADVAFNYRPLLENEVWSAEPGIYIYGVGGFRQDNSTIVGRQRPEVLTRRSMVLEDQIIAV